VLSLLRATTALVSSSKERKQRHPRCMICATRRVRSAAIVYRISEEARDIFLSHRQRRRIARDSRSAPRTPSVCTAAGRSEPISSGTTSAASSDRSRTEETRAARMLIERGFDRDDAVFFWIVQDKIFFARRLSVSSHSNFVTGEAIAKCRASCVEDARRSKYFALGSS